MVSAFRTMEQQRALFEAAVKKYGSIQAASKWVAAPGKSHHGPTVDMFGHKPGEFGIAVDLGVVGHTAVSGQWPPSVAARMDALCARYGFQSPMSWEDWHYEPRTDLLAIYHARINIKPVPEEDEVKTESDPIIDMQGPDDTGRDSYWIVNLQTGNLQNWNGARPIRNLKDIVPGAVLPLKAAVAWPDGNGILCISDDERQDTNGHWVASTYHISPGM